MDHHLMPPAFDRLADQPVVMAIAIACRGIEEIHAEIERAADGGDRFRIVGRAVGARHAVAAETDRRDYEIGTAEAVTLHLEPPPLPQRAPRTHNLGTKSMCSQIPDRR